MSAKAFIVLNKKHFSLLSGDDEGKQILADLGNALAAYNAELLKRGKDIYSNRYWVCNRDEPYARRVIEDILEGEMQKIPAEEKTRKFMDERVFPAGFKTEAPGEIQCRKCARVILGKDCHTGSVKYKNGKLVSCEDFEAHK